MFSFMACKYIKSVALHHICGVPQNSFHEPTMKKATDEKKKPLLLFHMFIFKYVVSLQNNYHLRSTSELFVVTRIDYGD